MTLASKLTAIGLVLELIGFILLFIPAEELKGRVDEGSQEKWVKMSGSNEADKKHLLERMFPYLPEPFISHYSRIALLLVIFGVILQIVAIFLPSCFKPTASTLIRLFFSQLNRVEGTTPYRLQMMALAATGPQRRRRKPLYLGPECSGKGLGINELTGDLFMAMNTPKYLKAY